MEVAYKVRSTATLSRICLNSRLNATTPSRHGVWLAVVCTRLTPAKPPNYLIRLGRVGAFHPIPRRLYGIKNAPRKRARIALRVIPDRLVDDADDFRAVVGAVGSLPRPIGVESPAPLVGVNRLDCMLEWLQR